MIWMNIAKVILLRRIKLRAKMNRSAAQLNNLGILERFYLLLWLCQKSRLVIRTLYI
jgi:hypothetical protein